jgi:hypothetical protein
MPEMVAVCKAKETAQFKIDRLIASIEYLTGAFKASSVAHNHLHRVHPKDRVFQVQNPAEARTTGEQLNLA